MWRERCEKQKFFVGQFAKPVNRKKVYAVNLKRALLVYIEKGSKIASLSDMEHYFQGGIKFTPNRWLKTKEW